MRITFFDFSSRVEVLVPRKPVLRFPLLIRCIRTRLKLEVREDDAAGLCPMVLIFSLSCWLQRMEM